MVMDKNQAVENYKSAVSDFESAYQRASNKNTVSAAAKELEDEKNDRITAENMASNYRRKY